MTGDDLTAAEQLALVERERERQKAEESLLRHVVTYAVRRGVEQDLDAVEAVAEVALDVREATVRVDVDAVEVVPEDVHPDKRAFPEDYQADVTAAAEERGSP